MRDLTLALDQGTTSSKALVLDASGRVVAGASRPLTVASPRSGWVEQDAEAVWASVAESAAEAVARVGADRIAAIGISNQRESVVAWRAGGRAIAPLISWQDQRGEPECARLATGANVALVRERTGLELTSMYSALKYRWLCEHADAAGLRVGTVDAWLIDRLSGGASYACEAGNASRTLLLDIERLAWDADLCALFGVDPGVLPPVWGSDADWGVTRGVPGLPDGLPIRAVLGDSHAALYGHWATTPERPRAGKATYGTGSSVMAPATDASDRRAGVSTTVAWTERGATQWAYEGNILYSGAGLDWLAGVLGVEGGRALTGLAAAADSSGGCSFVPALNGLGAPWWDAAAVGTLTGLSARTGRPQIARAGLESVAHQICDVVDVMDPDRELDVLHAGGGATASQELMQIQADLLGRTLVVANVPDISAVGAGVMAARAVGLDIAPPPDAVRVVAPRDGFTDDDRARARDRWRDALVRAGVDAGRTPTTRTPTTQE